MRKLFERFYLCGLLISVTLVIGSAVPATDEVKILPGDPENEDEFGRSVSISGDYILIGNPEDDDMGPRSGSAYIFRWNGSTWIQNTKLVAPDGTSTAQFGCSVSISGEYALVGAFRDKAGGNQAGAAYIWRHSGGVWVYVDKLVPAVPEPNSEFGNAVVTDGNYAVISAHRAEHMGKGTGVIYIFERNGLNWVEDAKLAADDLGDAAYYGNDANVLGNTLMVGAIGEASAGSYTGAVYVYDHSGTSWDFKQKLMASDTIGDARFGRSIALWNTWALIGAETVDGVVTDTGAAYIFRLVAGTWTEQAKLEPSDPIPGQGFGFSVDMCPNYALIGSPFYSDSVDNSGKLYLLTLEADEWIQHMTMMPSDPNEGAWFGYSVAVQSEEALAGAFGAEHAGIQTGAAYWFQDFTATAPTATPSVLTYDIILYDDYLSEDDLFRLSRQYINPSGALAVDEYIILDVFGAFWFWPGWSETVDYKTWTLPAGSADSETILQFTWPAVDGTVTGLKFWGAILHAGTSDLILYDMEEWGYSSK
jgi:FG-GAP repeat